uniref:Deoxyuridine 5'-triphosphate nucleotidohydrolase n=1 Tax=Tetranychus urticae TaxID=32264 RepID=T1KIJ8_TETUR
MIESLNFCKCYPDVPTPTRATAGSIGFDLMSWEDVVLTSQKIVIVRTGIKIQPPAGTYVRLASRSGLASKGIVVQGGVIDPDYTGEIKVILHNFSDNHIIIKKGMKIAQMIVERAEVPDLIEFPSLPGCSERGDCGFGSSGI